MTSINNINGYGIGFNGGYAARKEDNKPAAEEEKQVQVQPEQKAPVNADEVLAFLEANNVFVAPTKVESGVKTSEVDPEMQARIEDAMGQFEVIYAVIAKEFGEDLAPHLVDLVMDKLLGVVA